MVGFPKKILKHFVHTIFWIILEWSIIIEVYMLSCANNVMPQCRTRWHHFFEDPWFIATPLPPQCLPIFVETMVYILGAFTSPSSFTSFPLLIWCFDDSMWYDYDNVSVNILMSWTLGFILWVPNQWHFMHSLTILLHQLSFVLYHSNLNISLWKWPLYTCSSCLRAWAIENWWRSKLSKLWIVKTMMI